MYHLYHRHEVWKTVCHVNKYMGKVVIKILQGSAVTQNMLGGLAICPKLQISYNVYVPKIMKIGWQQTKLLQKIIRLTFWPTLYMGVRHQGQCKFFY